MLVKNISSLNAQETADRHYRLASTDWRYKWIAIMHIDTIDDLIILEVP